MWDGFENITEPFLHVFIQCREFLRGGQHLHTFTDGSNGIETIVQATLDNCTPTTTVNQQCTNPSNYKGV